MFNYNGKSLKNNEVQNISIIIELGEEFKNDNWRRNERYVHEQLVKSNNAIPMSIESPIEDLVYLQPTFSGETDEGYFVKTDKDYELLIDAYNKVTRTFKGKTVQVSVHSDLLSDEYNEIPMSLAEFVGCYSLDCE